MLSMRDLMWAALAGPAIVAGAAVISAIFGG